MKINSLQCKDFKCFDSALFQFGDRVGIFGDNFRGKTSIPEAIVFALFGTTLTGSPHADGLVRKGTKNAEVTLGFEVGGEQHEVVRVRGKKSEVYLDGAKSTQTEIDKLVGEKERFLAVFTPGYFTVLPDKDGREMLMRLVKPPTQDEVVAKLSKTEQDLLKNEVLRDPEALAKEKRGEIKETGAELNKTLGQIEVYKERANVEVPETLQFDETELRGLRDQLRQMESDLPSRIRELKSTLSGMGREYEAFKSQIKPLPEAPYAEGDSCPVCAQKLTGEALVHTLAHHNRQVTELNTRNDDLKSKAKGILEKGNQLRTQLNELENQHTATDVNNLKTRIEEIEAEKTRVVAHNGQVSRLQMEAIDNRERLEKAQTYVSQLEASKETLAAQVQAIGAYRAKLAEMQVEQLKQHLNRVDIQLFDIAKTTSEVKAVFRVLYDGREFKTLSYSEGIRANLEISTLFNKVLGTEYPVFIDNAESITHFAQPLTKQLFLATVVQGQDLKVESDAQVKGDVA